MSIVKTDVTVIPSSIPQGGNAQVTVTLSAKPEKSLTDGILKIQAADNFKFSKITSPSDGSAVIQNQNLITWNIGTLGTQQPENALLIYDVIYTGNAFGTFPITSSSILTDGNQEPFPLMNPTITISENGEDIIVEPCPEPIDIIVPPCQDSVHVTVPNVPIAGLGRIIQMDVTINNVCPGKRTAVSVILSEEDTQGILHPRGVKHFMIPALSGEICQSVTLKCIQFSVPEALDPDAVTDSLCHTRKFSAQVLANYVDTDFQCCDANVITL